MCNQASDMVTYIRALVNV